MPQKSCRDLLGESYPVARSYFAALLPDGTMLLFVCGRVLGHVLVFLAAGAKIPQTRSL